MKPARTFVTVQQNSTLRMLGSSIQQAGLTRFYKNISLIRLHIVAWLLVWHFKYRLVFHLFSQNLDYVYTTPDRSENGAKK